jgi:hypothetical protein
VKVIFLSRTHLSQRHTLEIKEPFRHREPTVAAAAMKNECESRAHKTDRLAKTFN